MKTWLKNKIKELYPGVDFDVLIPPSPEMGDYSVNLAFVLVRANRGNTEGDGKNGSRKKKNFEEVGRELTEEFNNSQDFKKYFEKIELAGGGYVNFHLNREFLQQKLGEMAGDKNFGCSNTLKGKKVVVEFTDPNPFKLFHIGHLMSNTIGETIANLYEKGLGANVVRVNYQGDIGLHVAMSVWGMDKLRTEMPDPNESLSEKVNYLGKAYALGAKAYGEHINPSKERSEIEEINKKIYNRSDSKISELYDLGRSWSLEYFDAIYKKLGTKFDKLFFESEAGPDGLRIVKENTPKIFRESDGAIVFDGDLYGLHTRVFINSQGLPTYETKELGLNKKKFELYSPDLSVIVTGNEINDYFKVLLKVMELTMPEVAQITSHIGHGMMRFSTGKMSSRTGDVITAESLIEQVIEKIKEKEDKSSPKTQKEYQDFAVSAIKYMILKHNIGSDIVFDFENALSIKGDAAPYLQYTYARLRSIGRKSGKRSQFGIKVAQNGFIIPSLIIGFGADLYRLKEEGELQIIRHLVNFPDAVKDSAEMHAPNNLTLYLYKLATLANNYYERVRILSDHTKRPERNARLLLVETVALVLKRGLNLLGIETLERI